MLDGSSAVRGGPTQMEHWRIMGTLGDIGAQLALSRRLGRIYGSVYDRTNETNQQYVMLHRQEYQLLHPYKGSERLQQRWQTFCMPILEIFIHYLGTSIVSLYSVELYKSASISTSLSMLECLPQPGANPTLPTLAPAPPNLRFHETPPASNLGGLSPQIVVWRYCYCNVRYC